MLLNVRLILMRRLRLVCSVLFFVALQFFGVPTAVAQQRHVTLYGLVDLGLEFDRVRQTNALPAGLPSIDQTFFGMGSGFESGSRWGLRGVEPLGGRLSAEFVLEGGFNAATGTLSQGGRMFGRQSTLSLVSRDLWRLDLGRQINFASSYFLPIDPFSEGFGQANIGSSFGSTNTTRYSNLLMMHADVFQGFTLGAGYSFNTQLAGIYAGGQGCALTQSCQAQTNQDSFNAHHNMRALTLGAKYQHGPLKLALAYDKIFGDASEQGQSPDPSAWVFGGIYDFKLLQVSMAVGRSHNGVINGQSSGTGNAASPLITATWVGGAVLFLPGAQTSSFMVGLTAALSQQTTLMASWQMQQPQGVFLRETAYANQQIYSAALSHKLSARTDVYSFASYGNNFGMIDTASSLVIGAGIRHTF
jgi:general bacterial porin, GBP family